MPGPLTRASAPGGRPASTGRWIVDRFPGRTTSFDPPRQRMPGGQLPLALAVIIVVPQLAEQRRRRLQPEPDQRPQRLDSVPPGQLLAFLTSTSVVVDGHLVYPVPEPQEAGGDLGLDVEARTLQVQPPPEVRSEDLVARLQ